jgi:hypothetical protein
MDIAAARHFSRKDADYPKIRQLKTRGREFVAQSARLSDCAGEEVW